MAAHSNQRFLKRLLMKNGKEIGCGKPALLFLGCLLFSLAGRAGAELSFEQHILSAGADHYYLLYFMLPVTILCFFPFLEDDSEIVVGRFRSYFRYFAVKWFGMGSIAAFVVLIQSAAVLLSGLGLPLQNGWTLPEGALAADLFAILRSCFPSPAAAFLGITVFQWFGSWFVAGLMMWLCHFLKSRATLIIILILYVDSVLWVKIPALQDLPVTGLNHLMIFHHNLTDAFRPAITAVTSFALLISLILTVKYRWNRFRITVPQKRSGLIVYYLRTYSASGHTGIAPEYAALLMLVLGITLYKGLNGADLDTAKNWFFELFAGHGTGYFRPFPFLEMLIANGAPLYLLAVFTERTFQARSLFIPIRVRSRTVLMFGTLSAGFIFLSAYILLWGAAAVLGGYALGLSFDHGALSLLFPQLLLKLFDCLVQYLFMMVLFCKTGHVTAGFLLVTAGNLLCILPNCLSRFVPFGLSCMTRFSAPPETISAAAYGYSYGYLILLSLLSLCWLLTIGKRKLIR